MNVSEAGAAAGSRPPDASKKPAGTETLSKTRFRLTKSSAVTRKQRLPFLQALSDLTGSGLSAGEAVRLLSQRIQEPALRALCQGLWERLSEGRPLSRAMEEFSAVFDDSTVNLIQAGEATGSLPEVLAALNEYYVEDIDDAVTRFTAALEPVMIIFLAGIIGTMVIAMYLPLFNLVKILQKHK